MLQNKGFFMLFRLFARLNRLALLWLLMMPLTQALAADFDHSHRRWQSLLSQYVKESGYASRVDYGEWKKQPQPLNAYLATLSSVDKAGFDRWNKNQQLAFLINAYNAFTVNLILQNYPVESIKDIGNFFRSAWKIDFIPLFGDIHSLDYIEHELIRGSGRYNEPRIHFALVCASIGCPKLQVEAFTEHNLQRLLELGASTFLADQSRNRFVAEENTLYLSPIFKWYGEDFAKKFGSVLNYVLPIISNGKEKPEEQIIKYLEYDWRLNAVGK